MIKRINDIGQVEFDLEKIIDAINQVAPFEGDNRQRFQFGLNMTGFSNLFGEVFEDVFCYMTDVKAWYMHSGSVWKRIDDVIIETATSVLSACLQIYTVNRGGPDENVSKLLKSLSDMAFVKRTVGLSKQGLYTDSSYFDTNPYLLNCPNGVYDLEKHLFRNHLSSDRFTLCTAAEYNEDAHFSRWNDFIDQITMNDKSTARYLQKSLGLGTVGKLIEECMFIFYGPTTRNGKSTLLNAVKDALGEYAGQVKAETLLQSKKDETGQEASPYLAALRNKRLVIANEMPDGSTGRVLKSNQIKAITGGDAIQTRFLYQNGIEFKPGFNIYLATNYLPRIKDVTLFTSHRIRPIEFRKHFSDSEQDQNLKTVFQDNKDAQSTILLWLIQGYQYYWLDKQLDGVGLADTENTQSTENEYRTEYDTLFNFINEHCNRKGQAETHNLFDLFQKLHPYQQQYKNIGQFNTAVRMLGFFDTKSNGKQYWQNLSISDE